MKQRCAILDCDYFSGGECAGLCMAPKEPRTISIQPTEVPKNQVPPRRLPPLHIDVAVPDPDPLPEQPDEKVETMATVVAIIAAVLALAMILFGSKIGHLVWLAH